ncbi:MAG: hypothetical protein MI920_15905 [Kiloniellales bacterium]|nr:hypothetical protein [Kiloniellales bacterium]
MANGDANAKLFGNIAMALVASNLASAVIGKQVSPDAAEAVRIYHEVIEELRKRQGAQPGA